MCLQQECGKVYVGQSACTITARCKEHECHIWLHQPEKSAVAQQCIETSNKIGFDEVTLLARSARYIDRLVKEATEIQLHPINVNRANKIHAEPGMVPSHKHASTQAKQRLRCATMAEDGAF
jgi:hypothetical protein